jgi:hypothetical protein
MRSWASTLVARFATATVGKSNRIFNSDNGQRVVEHSLRVRAMDILATRLVGVRSSYFRRLCVVERGQVLRHVLWLLVQHVVCSWRARFPFYHTIVQPIRRRHRKQVTVVLGCLHSRAPAIEHGDGVYFIKLSAGDDYNVTGEHSGKITVRSLRDILPESYFTGRVSGSKAAI